MCGIAGVLSLNPSFDNDGLIHRILQQQYHRGPDNSGSVTIENKNVRLSLGHNRLSILDLSQDANQPMWDSEGKYCLVFNGEIYNYIELRKILSAKGYQFKTRSDTEVLLTAFKHWGQDAVLQFNGMFAFAIYEVATETLYLYRDRFAQKPLYYYFDDEVLCFASESNQLAKYFSLKPNRQYLLRGLSYWIYENGTSETAFERLHEVTAGQCLKIKFKNHRIQRERLQYYNLADRVRNTKAIDQATAIDQLIHHLERSVTYRLRSDVPVAVSLSGGLDSTSIASIAQQLDTHMIGFSFSDPDDKRSEAPMVEKLRQQQNLPVNYIYLDKSDLASSFWQTLAAQGAPFPGLSVVAQNMLYKRVHESGVKVLLGGQGGDELFLGYRKYLLWSLKKHFRNKKYLAAVMGCCYLLPVLLSEVLRFKSYYQRFNSYRRDSLEVKGFGQISNPMGLQPQQSLQQRQIVDLLQTSIPSLLRYEDRNSMAYSIESRLPFMDYELAEFALSLPDHLKVNRGYGKWILRQAVQQFIPSAICFARYKRGFDVPEKAWIENGLGASLRGSILADKRALEAYTETKLNVNKLFSDHNLTTKKSNLNLAITLAWLSDWV